MLLAINKLKDKHSHRIPKTDSTVRTFAFKFSRPLFGFCFISLTNKRQKVCRNMILEFGGLAGEVFLNHKSYLEGNRVVELS